jgi:hypothetical protein
VRGWLGATLAEGGGDFVRWRDRPAVVAHWSWPHTALRTLVFDEVSAYGTAVTWEAHFSYLRAAVGDGGCWHEGGGSTKTRTQRGRPAVPPQ